MKQIELNGEKYLLLFNNRVHTFLRTKHNIDPFKPDEKIDWMDDPEVVEDIGYLAAKEGSKFKGEDLQLTKDQFSALLTGQAAMQILQEYIESVNSWANYIIENTKKQSPGTK